MSIRSMTGFARSDGADEAASWYWELRSVNGRGLDVRMRVPPGCDGLETEGRERIKRRLTRGNVGATLHEGHINRTPKLVINSDTLDQILVHAEALRTRLQAPPPTVEGILGLRGVLETVEPVTDDAMLESRRAAQLAGLDAALDGLVAARTSEGAHLKQSIEGHLARISELVAAVSASPARSPEAIRSNLDAQLARLLDNDKVALDPARLHQEVAILATKADIEEEIERLRAHIAAAVELLGQDDAIGRRFDFLVQEFNREANTLCSKSNSSQVTQLGLELKAQIEQMREQVQNIE